MGVVENKNTNFIKLTAIDRHHFILSNDTQYTVHGYGCILQHVIIQEQNKITYNIIQTKKKWVKNRIRKVTI